MVHCGLEYVPFAPTYVTTAFTELADAGADAVIGHHPHVPQGIFFHNHRPCLLQPGQFCLFTSPPIFFWRKLGYMVRLHICDKGVKGVEIIPYTDP